MRASMLISTRIEQESTRSDGSEYLSVLPADDDGDNNADWIDIEENDNKPALTALVASLTSKAAK